MAGGLIDEIFIALGVKVDSKDLEKLDRQFNKVIKKAQNLNKGSKAGKGLDAFFNGITKMTRMLPKGNSSMGQMANMLKLAGGAAGAAAGAVVSVGTAVVATTIAINKMTESLARNNQYYSTFQRRTGASAYGASGFATAASFLDMNVSEAQALNEMQNLQGRLMELQLTGQGAMPFQLAGINPMGMNSQDVMRALNRRMQGLSAMEQAYLADQLGLSSNLPMLQLNPEEFERQIAEGRQYSLTDDQLAQLMEYGTELKKINKQWDYMGKRINLLVAGPAMKFGKALANFYEQFVNIEVSIATMIKRFIELNPLVQGLVFSFKLIGAVLRDIWVMLEDVMAFMSGSQPSLLGQKTGYNSFEEMMRGNFPVIDKLIGSLEDVKEAANNLVDFMKRFKNPGNLVNKDNLSFLYDLANPYKLGNNVAKQVTQNNTFYNVREGENESILERANLFFNGATT